MRRKKAEWGWNAFVFVDVNQNGIGRTADHE
jgi:hypothetical protein